MDGLLGDQGETAGSDYVITALVPFKGSAGRNKFSLSSSGVQSMNQDVHPVVIVRL